MLQNAEQQVEDLKLQLDDALGAEEILVQLTERNLMLSEVIVPKATPLRNSALIYLLVENRGDARNYRGFGSSQRTQRRTRGKSRRNGEISARGNRYVGSLPDVGAH